MGDMELFFVQAQDSSSGNGSRIAAGGAANSFGGHVMRGKATWVYDISEIP